MFCIYVSWSSILPFPTSHCIKISFSCCICKTFCSAWGYSRNTISTDTSSKGLTGTDSAWDGKYRSAEERYPTKVVSVSGSQPREEYGINVPGQAGAKAWCLWSSDNAPHPHVASTTDRMKRNSHWRPSSSPCGHSKHLWTLLIAFLSWPHFSLLTIWTAWESSFISHWIQACPVYTIFWVYQSHAWWKSLILMTHSS